MHSSPSGIFLLCLVEVELVIQWGLRAMAVVLMDKSADYFLKQLVDSVSKNEEAYHSYHDQRDSMSPNRWFCPTNSQTSNVFNVCRVVLI